MSFEQQFIVVNDENARFSGIFDSIIQSVQVGLQALPTIQQLIGGGGVSGGAGGGCSGQAKGLSAIRTCSAQVLAALDALTAQIGQQPYEQIVSQAQALVAVLSNPTYFYQAKRGDDAAALADAKTQAQAKLQRILASAAGANSTPVTAITNQAGQVVLSGGNVATTGLDSLSSVLNSPLVIYGALGVLGFILIKRATK